MCISQAEDPADGHKADIPVNHIVAVNGSTMSHSATPGGLGMHAKTYRLMIQIDKMRSRPSPKCKKLFSLLRLDDEEEPAKKRRPLLQKPTKKACAKGSCKLKTCTFGTTLALQCEQCDKHYVMTKEDKSYPCSVCFEAFPTSQSLYIHIRKHFVCDICQTECSSQMTYDKHVRLHVSTDPLCPYKCHQCAKIFDLKESVKQHYLEDHFKKFQNTVLQVTSPTATKQVDYRCVRCNVSFQHEQTYR